jgi:hypothetical protein
MSELSIASRAFSLAMTTRPTSGKLPSRMRKFGVGRAIGQVIPQETVIAAIILRPDTRDFAESFFELGELVLYPFQPSPNLLHIEGIAF